MGVGVAFTMVLLGAVGGAGGAKVIVGATGALGAVGGAGGSRLTVGAPGAGGAVGRLGESSAYTAGAICTVSIDTKSVTTISFFNFSKILFIFLIFQLLIQIINYKFFS